MKFFLVLSFFLLILPGFAQEDDEKMVNDLQKAQEAKAKRTQNIASKFTSSEPPDFAKELKKLGHETLTTAALFDEKVIVLLEEGIKHLKVDEAPKEFREAALMGKLKGHPMEQVFKTFPKLKAITADLLSDKAALLGLLGILKRKNDFKIMGYLCLGILIFGWILQGVLISKEWGFFKRLGLRLTLSIAFSLLTVGVFFHFFSVELKPTAEIIKKHTFSRS